MSGLANGTSYTFRIRAVNDYDGVGLGPASEAVTVTAGAPGTAPTGLAATPGNEQVTLSWLPASGSDVVFYSYTANADAASPDWKLAEPSLLIHDDASDPTAYIRYTVPDLDNYTTYAFAVRAGNANGPGPATPTVRATPVPAGTPQRPAGFRAVPGHQLVRLAWSPPSSVHPVTSYQYRQSTDGGATWNPDWTAIPGSGADTAEYLLDGLDNGTTYTFELRALNAVTNSQTLVGAAARAQATPGPAAATEMIDRGSSGQLTTPDGRTYTVIQLSPPGRSRLAHRRPRHHRHRRPHLHPAVSAGRHPRDCLALRLHRHRPGGPGHRRRPALDGPGADLHRAQPGPALGSRQPPAPPAAL